MTKKCLRELDKLKVHLRNIITMETETTMARHECKVHNKKVKCEKWKTYTDMIKKEAKRLRESLKELSECLGEISKG